MSGEPFWQYKRRMLERFDAHIAECRRARLELERQEAARAAQLDLLGGVDVERDAIKAESKKRKTA